MAFARFRTEVGGSLAATRRNVPQLLETLLSLEETNPMTLDHINSSIPVAKQGRLLGHLNRQQNRQRQQSMLMRSIQNIERNKSI